MIRKSFAALGATLALALGLTACASGDTGQTDTAPADTAGSAADGQNAQQDAQQDAGGSASGGGDVRLVIDGAEVTIDSPIVTCAESGGDVMIAVTNDKFDASQGLGAIVSAGDEPTITSVGLVTSDGSAVAYVEGSGMGSATVTKTGSTYEFTGEGVLTDMNNPTSIETVPFEFDVTCS